MYEIQLRSGVKTIFSRSDVSWFADRFRNINDMDRAMRNAVNRSRNLRLVDRATAVLFVESELQKADQVDKAKNAEIKAAKAKLSVPPIAEPIVEESQVANEEIGRKRDPAAMKADDVVSVYKEGPRVMLQTTASSLDTFAPALAKVFADAAYTEDDVDGFFKSAMPHALALAIKVAGYKIDSVKEERVLTSGYLDPEDKQRIASS